MAAVVERRAGAGVGNGSAPAGLSASTLLTMTLAEILDVDAERLAALCERFGIARLAVFGSVARGEADADSDLDLIYELHPGARLGWEIEDLVDQLERLYGRHVDLVSRRGLHPRLCAVVLAEAQPLYAP